MKTYQVSATVKNIYNNGIDTIATTYTAKNENKALQGFKQYLESNKNLKSFSNIIIKG